MEKLYGDESTIVAPRKTVSVPGVGVFIAPNAVARLFQLHAYTKCPRFGSRQTERVLYPIL